MLELHGVGHRYGHSDFLFRELDLRVDTGEIVALLAPNGRGKSTLLRGAARLQPFTEGSAVAAETVGFVPQATQVTFGFSVFDMVLMGRARHLGPLTSPGPTDRERAAEALAATGLSELAERPFPSLSGGEQQLVLIARAMASEARLLLLDEPTAALDLANQGVVLRLLIELATDGYGVLFSTHQPDHALAVATRAALLAAPRDLRVGKPEKVLTEEALSELYGLPMRRMRVSTPDSDELRIAVQYT
ncbi:ABC transporter ATP-binding protein [Haloechinothrix sp. LS1_15]|uniref:ABC transporter ATP-binding protein n=1 Tax=Haloechinothrix sp. LS1_15 TaxID=2652248 RepID=UPI002946B90C|nr:ABC transporter ATP-binding protein [Haloechinothrix sp. LS1_15]MDV6013636.1 ABC transporter ATP-binding protein [Haloechinothrix sp. LS1_15]